MEILMVFVLVATYFFGIATVQPPEKEITPTKIEITVEKELPPEKETP